METNQSLSEVSDGEEVYTMEGGQSWGSGLGVPWSTLHSPTYSDQIPVGLFSTFLHIMYSSHIHSFFANSAWTPVGLFKILF